jgi:hypothetical protein
LAKKLIDFELDLSDASLCIGYDSLYIDKSTFEPSSPFEQSYGKAKKTSTH